jgi:hypothetical protein
MFVVLTLDDDGQQVVCNDSFATFSMAAGYVRRQLDSCKCRRANPGFYSIIMVDLKVPQADNYSYATITYA